ncbi:hypothetical protein SARC_01286 [Sphaeroforma arctica JP610]|uniref:Uncharacterized protein n=1 Tax=Sphaeroforma arctica JP610 TaxID=667725 RepID=A0A0L0GEB1_9EUKA|nr:hypothetical protein SARC_01286 [Sphaeroforma arctica JP610]KNC86563.1 hypothetical protein SARC_01286 [Sphaeroforma arctica JP610]|eukprot:XP_014160465.1 hypothetical protein SARC_01286 [Sphaeroforma arctica JP610]
MDIFIFRYAATGQFPPNTNKGQAFVHDPKLSDKSVVKAAVRLRFRNTVGQVMMCRRVMQLTAKPKSMQLKTLDSTIQEHRGAGHDVQASHATHGQAEGQAAEWDG